MRQKPPYTICRRAFLTFAGASVGGAGLSSALPLSGQAADFPIQPPPQGLARFYFYRLDEPLLLAVAPAVVVNGRTVGRLSRGALFFRDARPGRYEVFLADDARQAVTLRLAEGQIAYLRASLDIGLGTTRLAIEQVEPQVALSEILALENASNDKQERLLQQ